MAQTVAIAILAILSVIGLGIAAWVLLPAFQGPDVARRDLGSHRLTIGAWLTVYVLNVLITLPFLPFLHLEQGFTAGTFVIAALATDVPMLLIVYVRLILPGALTWRELGLKPLPLGYVMRMGVTTGVVGLVAIEIIGSFLSQLGLQSNQLDQFRPILSEGPLAFAILLIAAGIMAPFVEELFFRGLLFGVYRRRQPLLVAYLVSSVLFTIGHLDVMRMNPNQMAGLSVGIFILASLLTWLYQHTGSLYPGMVAHALNNATGLILVYAFGLR